MLLPTVYVLNPLERRVWMPTTEGQVLWCHEHHGTVGFHAFVDADGVYGPKVGLQGQKLNLFIGYFLKNGMRVGRWLR